MNTLLSMTVFRLDASDVKEIAEAWGRQRNMPIEVAITSRWFRSRITITTPFFVNDAIRNQLRQHIAAEQQERTAW